MYDNSLKISRRVRRRRGLHKHIRGTSERPRLVVTRSLKHIYAQIIDDDRGVTLCALGSMSRDLRSRIRGGGNIAAAKVVGSALAERAKSLRIDRICFDRAGYKYHGRIKALAEALREGGLSF